ncbi:MAG TPA: ATP synthase subunit I [Candidatus Sulfotelmatobacter sp.]|nr:ATP synthase subunit I [Candidatus Sulfotelmatobacter sp.]
MTASPTRPPESPTSGTAADRFFAAAIPRMLRFVIILGGVFTLLVAWRFGRVVAVGFAAGALIAYSSFRSLNKAVQSLASRIVDTQRPEKGYSLVHGFFLRYLLAGIVAYVIFTSSSQAFRGFLFGLGTPIAAMLTEAGFEAYTALRRGY